MFPLKLRRYDYTRKGSARASKRPGMDSSMDDPAQLRQFAEECFRSAHKTENPKLKAMLLSMTQCWIELAVYTERLRELTATESKPDCES